MTTVAGVLESPDWTLGEKWVVRWQFGLLGGFYAALADVISRADQENLSLLECGFPQEVNGFRAWAYGDLAERLRKAGLPV